MSYSGIPKVDNPLLLIKTNSVQEDINEMKKLIKKLSNNEKIQNTKLQTKYVSTPNLEENIKQRERNHKLYFENCVYKNCGKKMSKQSTTASRNSTKGSKSRKKKSLANNKKQKLINMKVKQLKRKCSKEVTDNVKVKENVVLNTRIVKQQKKPFKNHTTFKEDPTLFKENTNSMADESEQEKSSFEDIPLFSVNEDITELEDELELSTEQHFDHYVPAHYAQSTISSRTKQFNQPIYSNMILKFPFVLGQSINKSHNLCVNIQQIHSLHKKKRVAKHSTHKTKTVVSSRMNVVSTQTRLSRRSYCPAIVEEDEEDREMEGKKIIEDARDRMQEEYNLVNINPNEVKPKCTCVEKGYPNRKSIRVDDGRDDSVLEVPVSCKFQNGFNKVKSTNSVYWASVLRKIKQYQVNVELGQHRSSVLVH